ncbi:MAG: amidohydrolase family protein [Betaproteobacteria bacterium]|nr:amidohydrolase family protein [Betaproteobacteria bacterium]
MNVPPQSTYALIGGRLIDGLGEDPINHSALIVSSGKVVAAGRADAIVIPRDAIKIDVTGLTVLPGIIDCHVHGTYRARDMRQHLLNAPTYNVLRSTAILDETLACGVTTARDMGGADAGFRQAIEEGFVVGPRLLIAVVMISQTGGHGDAWLPAGIRIQKRAWLPSPVADGVDDVRRLVRHVLMAGADFVKICATGGITSVTDSWDEAQFTVAELRTAVTEAAMRRKRVAVHAEGIEGIRPALEAGVHSLEHGWFIDEECIDTMVRQGTWWVPTLALVPLSVEHRKKNAAWNAQQLAKEDAKDAEIYAKMQAHIPLYREALKRGVNIAFGTDQSHRLLVGENLVELQFMVDWLGMSPMEAIVSATSRAAECIERPELGALVPGRLADVLVVADDPLANIKLLNERAHIKMVMKDGRIWKNILQ